MLEPGKFECEEHDIPDLKK